MNDTTDPTDEQIDKFFDALLPPNEEIDSATASIILERQGFDRPRLAAALKSRLQQRVERLRATGEEVPAELLKLLAKL